MELNYPESNVLEVSLFGTGGGYGESIVIHCPGDKWIIIDSCINPKDRSVIPLEYLKNLKVDLKKVVLIVATHWHDDHIQGLSQILEQCINSRFVLARSTDLSKFVKLVGLDVSKDKEARSTTEYYKCIRLSKDRGFKLMEACADRTIFLDNVNHKKIAIISLSPSDYSSHLFDLEISSLMQEFAAANKKIVLKCPNSRSVVILVKAGDYNVLLGADLEVEQDDRLGWKDIILNSSFKSEKASLFKVPHHGSENGYSEDLWDKLIDKNPKVGITPWNRNSRLPNPEMLKLYCKLSDSVYMTSPNINLKPKKRDREVTKLIKHFEYRISELKFSFGHIRYRVDIENNTGWDVSVDGEGFQVQ